MIREAERHALAFVLLGANAAASSFLVQDGAPFKGIRESDLPSTHAALDAYIVLLRAFLYLLKKSMENDQGLSLSIGSTFDELADKLSNATDLSSDFFDLSQEAELESREGVGYVLDFSLAMFRHTLCGRIEGLAGWKAPRTPDMPEPGYVGTAVYFGTVLVEVAAHNLGLLRTKLSQTRT